MEKVKKMSTLPMDAKEKLIRTDYAEYVRSESSENTSGYVPIGDRILLKIDESVVKSSGGVWFTDEQVYKQSMAAETGVIVAKGEAAFRWTFDKSREWYGRVPEVGERVYVERYAGRLLKGKDDHMYRVMDDRCIAAIEIKAEE